MSPKTLQNHLRNNFLKARYTFALCNKTVTRTFNIESRIEIMEFFVLYSRRNVAKTSQFLNKALGHFVHIYVFCNVNKVNNMKS